MKSLIINIIKCIFLNIQNLCNKSLYNENLYNKNFFKSLNFLNFSSINIFECNKFIFYQFKFFSNYILKKNKYLKFIQSKFCSWEYWEEFNLFNYMAPGSNVWSFKKEKKYISLYDYYFSYPYYIKVNENPVFVKWYIKWVCNQYEKYMYGDLLENRMKKIEYLIINGKDEEADIIQDSILDSKYKAVKFFLGGFSDDTISNVISRLFHGDTNSLLKLCDSLMIRQLLRIIYPDHAHNACFSEYRRGYSRYYLMGLNGVYVFGRMKNLKGYKIWLYDSFHEDLGHNVIDFHRLLLGGRRIVKDCKEIQNLSKINNLVN